MLVGYMRVSTSGDRQVLDLQVTRINPGGQKRITYLRIGSPGSAAIVLVWPRRWVSSNPAIAWWSGSWTDLADRCRISSLL